MAPAMILERLDERFRVLTGGSRTAVARHQTLQAAVDWSYDLLADAERSGARPAVGVRRRVHPRRRRSGGRRRRDRRVRRARPPGRARREVARGGRPRPGDATASWRPSASTRPRKLAESGTADAVRARHAEHYRSWATALAPQLTGPGDLDAIDRLEGALEHLRLMLDAYRDAGRGDVVVDLFADLLPVLGSRARPGGDPPDRFRARDPRRRPRAAEPGPRAARPPQVVARPRRSRAPRRGVGGVRRAGRDPGAGPGPACAGEPPGGLRGRPGRGLRPDPAGGGRGGKPWRRVPGRPDSRGGPLLRGGRHPGVRPDARLRRRGAPRGGAGGQRPPPSDVADRDGDAAGPRRPGPGRGPAGRGGRPRHAWGSRIISPRPSSSRGSCGSSRVGSARRPSRSDTGSRPIAISATAGACATCSPSWSGSRCSGDPPGWQRSSSAVSIGPGPRSASRSTATSRRPSVGSRRSSSNDSARRVAAPRRVARQRDHDRPRARHPRSRSPRARRRMTTARLPTGTVTFLFTDLAGSTRA